MIYSFFFFIYSITIERTSLEIDGKCSLKFVSDPSLPTSSLLPFPVPLLKRVRIIPDISQNKDFDTDTSSFSLLSYYSKKMKHYVINTKTSSIDFKLRKSEKKVYQIKKHRKDSKSILKDRTHYYSSSLTWHGLKSLITSLFETAIVQFSILHLLG